MAILKPIAIPNFDYSAPEWRHPPLIASTMCPHDVTRRFSDVPVGRED
jgi:hypothetical protein